MTEPVTWTRVAEYRDIRYEHSGTGIAKVTIDRPEVRNAFRPETVAEMIDAFARIRDRHPAQLRIVGEIEGTPLWPSFQQRSDLNF